MPPNEAALAKALEALQQVELESFTATPSTIAPFGKSELRWRVNAPAGVHLELDGHQVPRTGSQVVHPGLTRTFKLVARASTLSSDVGQVTVVVDLGACIQITLSEADVQAKLLEVVEMLMAQDPQLTLRSPPVVDVTPAGIVMKLRFEIHVKHSRNPDFNIDALIGLAVDSDGIAPFFREFSADLDFSFWEDALNILIDATAGTLAGGPFIHIAASQAETAAREKARRDILDGIAGGIAEFLLIAPPGFSPHQVFLRDDGIDVRLCPHPGVAITSFRHPEFQLTAVKAGRYGATSTSRAGPAKARTSKGSSRGTPKRAVPRRKR
ncbi:MAG TPA: hypothetical protein VFY71_03145 [Planctomycetota bacterium]|nr:hypothetical protein [Planctomycetota bacterium]